MTAKAAGTAQAPPQLRCSTSIVNWLFSGALTYRDGAIAAWRRPDTGQLAYPYPEITGYLLTLAAGTELSNPQKTIMRRAAAWLIKRHEKPETQSRPHEPGVVYTFDRYVQATGLLNYGMTYDDTAAIDTGARLLAELARYVVRDRAAHPLAEGSSPPTRPPCWSSVGSLHLLKTIQGLCLWGQISGAQTGFDAAELLIKSAADTVCIESPHFAGELGHHYLHPYCYALEGLWVWSQVAGDATALARVAAGVTELLRFTNADGGISRTAEQPGTQYDVTAQAVRLAALLTLDRDAWQPSVRCLLDAATTVAPAAQYLPYRPGSPVHQSSWASMFTAQALRANHQPMTWQLLV